jgi:Flp pilus assembly protein TadD
LGGLFPSEAGFYFGRGGVYQSQGDDDRAIADLNEAVRLNPKDADFYGRRAISYEKKGDVAKALTDFRKAIALDAKNKEAANGLKRIEQTHAR